MNGLDELGETAARQNVTRSIKGNIIIDEYAGLGIPLWRFLSKSVPAGIDNRRKDIAQVWQY